MVEVKEKLEIDPKSPVIKKSVKIGNDDRQFIIRIPRKISDQTILIDFKREYSANISFDLRKPNELVVELKNG